VGAVVGPVGFILCLLAYMVLLQNRCRAVQENCTRTQGIDSWKYENGEWKCEATAVKLRRTRNTETQLQNRKESTTGNVSNSLPEHLDSAGISPSAATGTRLPLPAASPCASRAQLPSSLSESSRKIRVVRAAWTGKGSHALRKGTGQAHAGKGFGAF